MKQYKASAFTDHIEKLTEENLFILFGEEKFFHDQLLSLIEKQVFGNKSEKDLNHHLFFGGESDMSSVLSACLSFPMLASRKLVVVKDFDKLRLEDEEAFLKYVQNPQKSTTLVLISDKWERKKFNNDLLNNAISVNCKGLNNAEVYQWVTQRFVESGMHVKKESIGFLIENIGNNVLRLNLEIEKIVNFLDPGKELNLEIISQLTGFSREVNIFNFQKVLASRDLKTSLRIGLQLLEQGNVLASILPMLFNFFRRMWVVKSLLLKNYSQARILQEVGGSPYAYTDIFNSVNNFKNKHLVRIFESLEESDIYLKTSQKADISILTLLCYYICKDENNGGSLRN